jgi:hypothetical protein
LLIKVSVQKRERKGENNIKLFICTLQDTAMFTCSKYFTFSETVRRLNKTQNVVYILYLLGTYSRDYLDILNFFTDELFTYVFEYKFDKFVKIFFTVQLETGTS